MGTPTPELIRAEKKRVAQAIRETQKRLAGIRPRHAGDLDAFKAIRETTARLKALYKEEQAILRAESASLREAAIAKARKEAADMVAAARAARKTALETANAGRTEKTPGRPVSNAKWAQTKSKASAAERRNKTRAEVDRMETEGEKRGWKVCGFTSRRCPLALDCTWNSEDIKRIREVDGAKPNKMEVCIYAISGGYTRCGECPYYKECYNHFKCFKLVRAGRVRW